MRHGICTMSIVPCRREPSGASEMVTQLLFGETYQVLEPGEDWLKIKTTFDRYECFISARQHTPASEKLLKALDAEKPAYAGDLVQMVHEKNRKSFPVTMGASLTICSLNEQSEFSTEGDTIVVTERSSADKILETASLYLHAPYLWGGKTPFGIDCSGFTQMVFRLNGYNLPRDAYQQVELGEPLSFVEEAMPGDIAFFDNEEGRIVHVGILLDNTRIIHASGSVRVDKLDHYGIHNAELRKYTHHLRVIKRLK